MSSTRLSRAPPAIAVCGRESGRPCSGSPLGELFLEAVAAAKPTPLGVCPAGGGDQPRGSAPADSRLANKAQGCAPPEAGIKPRDSALAESRLASKLERLGRRSRRL